MWLRAFFWTGDRDPVRERDRLRDLSFERDFRSAERERDRCFDRDRSRDLSFDRSRDRDRDLERDAFLLFGVLLLDRDRLRPLFRLGDLERERDRDRDLERDLDRESERRPRLRERDLLRLELRRDRERDRLRLRLPFPRFRLLSSDRRMRRPCKSAPSSFSSAFFMSAAEAKSTMPMFRSRLWASAYVTSPAWRMKSFRSCGRKEGERGTCVGAVGDDHSHETVRVAVAVEKGAVCDVIGMGVTADGFTCRSVPRITHQEQDQSDSRREGERDILSVVIS